MAPRPKERRGEEKEIQSDGKARPDEKNQKISKIHRAAFRELRSRPQEISVTTTNTNK